MQTATTSDGSELVEVVQGGVNKKMTAAILSKFQGNWAWPGNSAPTASSAGDWWITTADLSDPFIPKWSLIIAKVAGANSVSANPDTSQFVVK